MDSLAPPGFHGQAIDAMISVLTSRRGRHGVAIRRMGPGGDWEQ